MTPLVAPKCDRQGGIAKHLPRYLVLVYVLIFVCVLTEPAASLRGPEDWQGIAEKSGKSTHVFYSSSSNDLLAGLMARRSKQHISLKHIPTTYRPHAPPHPRRSNLTPSHPRSFLTPKKPHAPSHFTTITKPPPPESFPDTAPHHHPSVAALKPLVDPPPTLRNYSQKPLVTQADSRHLPPVTHSTQDGSKTELAKELHAGGGNDMKKNTTSESVTKNKRRRVLRLRLPQASPTLRVRMRPRRLGDEGTAEAMIGAGRRVSRRLSRRKAAYPRRHLLDNRRSLTPGPPYDHYRRMVHVPLRSPTTLAPLPSMLHTLPQLPSLTNQPTHSKKSLHGRLYPKKTLPQSSPPFVPIFRKDKPPGTSHFLSPTPLPSPPPPPPPAPSHPPPPPRPHPRPHPIPTRPYHLPSPRPHPHPPHSLHSSSPSPHPTFITTPIPSLPLSFPTVPPHIPSSPMPAVFHHRFHHTPPLRSMHSARPPAVFNLGRSSTPRPLVHPPPPPPPPPSESKSPSPPPLTPSPVRSSFPTTTSPPPRIPLEPSREHRKSDYPTYASVPATSFTCRATPRPGIYVDVETGCQAWHVCEADGRQHSFLCPNGTIFSQLVLTCDWWYNVRCGSDSVNTIHTRPSREISEVHTDPEELYGRKIIQKPTKPYLPDHKAFMTPADGEPELLESLVASYH